MSAFSVLRGSQSSWREKEGERSFHSKYEQGQQRPWDPRARRGHPPLPRNGRSSRPQDAPLVLLPTSLPFPKLSFCPQRCLSRGEPSGPQPRERRERALCWEKRPALQILSPEAVPSEEILQSLSSATLSPSPAPDPAQPLVQPPAARDGERLVVCPVGKLPSFAAQAVY